MRIFEKHPTLDAYRFGPSFTPYAIVATEKRFTDSEMAAEYWQAHAFHERAVRGQSCIELIMEREVEVWTRFATLPNYDEDAL